MNARLSAQPVDDAGGCLASMVGSEDYPCLGARSVFNRDRATVGVFDEIGTERAAAELLKGLSHFSADTDIEGGLASFIAAFRGPEIESEKHFEQLLWRQLQLMHNADTEEWNKDVADDPADAHFAFSAGATAYFVVGLNPKASRLARQFPLPTLVFNLHAQFEALRASEQFDGIRDAIRDRDEMLQGNLNPMVSDHGDSPEARQYSGRAVSEDWVAPFSTRGS